MTEVAAYHTTKEMRRAKNILAHEISKRLKKNKEAPGSGLISQQQRQEGFSSFPADLQSMVREAAGVRRLAWLDNQALQTAFEDGVQRAGLRLVM